MEVGGDEHRDDDDPGRVASAGWYQDTFVPGVTRYFDGEGWAESRQPDNADELERLWFRRQAVRRRVLVSTVVALWVCRAASGTACRRAGACDPALAAVLLARPGPFGTVSQVGESVECRDVRRVLQSVWVSSSSSIEDLDAACSPSATCRNMRDVTFDRYGDTEVDRALAWREQLAREGKNAL